MFDNCIEKIFMTIKSSFSHYTQQNYNKIKNRHLQIQKYFQIELRHRMNISSVMKTKKILQYLSPRVGTCTKIISPKK